MYSLQAQVSIADIDRRAAQQLLLSPHHSYLLVIKRLLHYSFM
jgi:hypothetical protein